MIGTILEWLASPSCSHLPHLLYVFFTFIYLAAPALSCGLQTLNCGMWDLIRDQTWEPCVRRAWSLSHWTQEGRKSPGTYILRIVLATVNLEALSWKELKAALAFCSGPLPVTLKSKNWRINSCDSPSRSFPTGLVPMPFLSKTFLILTLMKRLTKCPWYPLVSLWEMYPLGFPQ